MGNKIAKMCGDSDFFQKLLEQYGDDFILLVVAEKAKKALQQKFQEFMNKIRQILKVFQSKINNLVDGKSQELTDQFQEIKRKVNKVVPEGIPYLQRKKGKSIDQFSGFNKMIKHIDDVRDQTLIEITQKHGKLQNQLLEKKNLLRRQIENEQPKIPLYEKLPDSVRFKILEQAEQEFSQQIAKSQERQKEVAQKNFNQSLTGLDDFMYQVTPETLLHDYVDKSIQQMVRNVFGDSMGGQINKFMDKF